jgi:hypothetical protein
MEEKLTLGNLGISFISFFLTDPCSEMLPAMAVDESRDTPSVVPAESRSSVEAAAPGEGWFSFQLAAFVFFLNGVFISQLPLLP